MEVAAVVTPTRLPRFRRAEVPPPFRITDDDVEIVRVVARHRLARSTDIAAFVGRSLDRTNERLQRLYHAGYLDRPRAQLDRFPTGSPHYVYALANRGARLLRERDGITVSNPDLSRKNRELGRPFIEHQLEIVNFEVALQRSVARRSDLRLVPADEMIAASRQPMPAGRAPFALRAKLSHRGWTRESSVIPDFVFGLHLPTGERRNFMVEIDRGTMPVHRSDPNQTSFEGKMRVYLAAYAAKQHHRQFGWQSFRVLTITTDRARIHSMQVSLRGLHVARSIGPSLFLFSTYADIAAADPLSLEWRDGLSSSVHLS